MDQKIKNYESRRDFESERISAVMPKEKYNNNRSESLSYIGENKKLILNSLKFRNQMKNQINHFRSKSESRVGTLNLKVPEAIKYRMERE